MKNINLNPFFLVKDVKYCDLFIGQNGEFYKIRNLKSNFITHYDWALSYLNKYNNKVYNLIKKNKIDPVEFLVNKMGFIRYSRVVNQCNPIVDFPDGIYKSANAKQIDSLYEVIAINCEYLNDEQLALIENVYDKKIGMCDKIYSKYL